MHVQACGARSPICCLIAFYLSPSFFLSLPPFFIDEKVTLTPTLPCAFAVLSVGLVQASPGSLQGWFLLTLPVFAETSPSQTFTWY